MTQTTASCGCSMKLVLQVIDCLALLLILVLQGSILDYYLILHNGGSAGWYFWFLADFLVLIAFMAAAVISYRHYKKKARLRKTGGATVEPDSSRLPSLPKLGSLPLVYIVWIFYSILLTAKVVLLFKLEVAQTLDQNSAFGPQLLKVVIAAAAVVFLLLVETHNDAEPHSDRQSYIYFLITSTVFEIFDSVTFLGILFPNQSKVILTFSLENTILAFSCINFILPTLALYKLSISEFGIRTRPLGLHILYKGLHLILINVPYLVVRIYLWTLYDHDVTLFLLKNVLAILLTVRTSVPDIRLWWQLFQESRRKHHERLEGGMELGVIYGRTDDHMDEINLNGDRTKVPKISQL